ncbi:hypothetical protein DPMN_021661 [Dreissena polymorpha]|uniref:Uncharacterized protein n=1 Tax=Dreissena polymorpha TaxID=45954 RepID=A0A9D4NMJ4_DREPO|nr:hypothetical protein DPMN_021661 [Dreissena polymorpha]
MGDYLFYLMIEAHDQLRHEFSKYYEVIRCYNLKFPGMAHTGHFLSSLLSMISDENPHTFWCESIPEDYVGFLEFLGRRLVPTK